MIGPAVSKLFIELNNIISAYKKTKILSDSDREKFRASIVLPDIARSLNSYTDYKGFRDFTLDVFGEVDGRRLLTEALEKSQYLFYRLESADDAKFMKAFVDDISGKKAKSIIRKQLVSHIFLNATNLDNSELLEYLISLLYETNDKQTADTTLRSLIYGSEISLFENAVLNGKVEIANFLVKTALEKFGRDYQEMVLERFSFSSHYLSILSSFLCNPDLCTEIRAIAYNKNCAIIKESDELVAAYAKNHKGAKLEDKADIGEVGTPYKYAAMVQVLATLKPLNKDFPDLDFVKIISNHKRKQISLVSGGEIHWVGMAAALEHISEYKLKQVYDSAFEISRIAADNILALRTPQVFACSTGEIDAVFKPLRAQIFRYILEEKTIPQMIKMSEEWHTMGFRLKLARKDIPTLRDFSQIAEWKPVAFTKETKIKVGKSTYTFTELTTSGELDKEGNILKHCASGYVEHCCKGEYHVFSVKKDGVNISTLGVDSNWPHEFREDQHSGFDNAEIDQETKQAGEKFLKVLNRAQTQYTDRGQITIKLPCRPFENHLGLLQENATPERLEANLRLIARMNRSHIYTFGEKNKDTTVDEFIAAVDKSQHRDSTKFTHAETAVRSKSREPATLLCL